MAVNGNGAETRGNQFEKYAGNLLQGIFPTAELTPEPGKLTSYKGTTLPDYLFLLNGCRPVYIEVTTSWLVMGNDPKERQRRILQTYVEQQFEQVGALILYAQNLISVKAIGLSFAVLERLAYGELKTVPAQSKSNYIAKSHGTEELRQLNGSLDLNSLLDLALKQVPIRH